MIHRGLEYELLTKDYHPIEGEIIYRIDQDYGDELPPLLGRVTHWGANNHDDFLVEVEQTYPQEVLDRWLKKYGKKEFKTILKELKKRDFWVIFCCYKKIE